MRSALLICISTLCFITRITCASVPVFEDAVPSNVRNTRRRYHANRNRSKEDVNDDAGDGQGSFFAKPHVDDQHVNPLVDHVQRRILQCMAKAPARHGLLVQIDLSDISEANLRTGDDDVEGEKNDDALYDDENDEEVVQRLRKRFVHKIATTWKNMPAEQRIGALGMVLSLATVPAWLIGSVQGIADSNIKKAKIMAAKAEVLKQAAQHANGASHVAAPPSPPPPVVVKPSSTPAPKAKRRDVEGQMAAKDQQFDQDFTVSIHFHPRDAASKVAKIIRVPSSASRVLVEFDDLIAHGSKAIGDFLHAGSAKAAQSHVSSALHRTSSQLSDITHGVSNAVSSAAKQASSIPVDHVPGRPLPKQDNLVVKKLIGYAGSASPIIYFPAAGITLYNMRKKPETKGELSKYRRSHSTIDRMVFPPVSCVPIAKVDGIDDYVIPPGGLDVEKALDDDWSDVYDDGVYVGTASQLVKRGVPVASITSKMPHPMKLLGIGTLATGIGYIMHRMNQKRDEAGEDGSSHLVRRSESSRPIDLRDVGEDDGSNLEKRMTGRIFFAGLLAGTALSKAGFGVPKLRPTITEKQRRDAEEAPSPLVKRTFVQSAMRVANNKVTIALGAMAGGYALIKSGLGGKMKNMVIKPKQPPPDASGAAMMKRSVEDDQDSEVVLQKRMGRVMGGILALAGGMYIAQRTGRRGQERENKNYEQQLAKVKPEHLAKRSFTDSDEGQVWLQRRAGEKNVFKKALSLSGDLVGSVSKKIGKMLHTNSKGFERAASRGRSLSRTPHGHFERLESVASTSSSRGRSFNRGRSFSRARSISRPRYASRPVQTVKSNEPRVKYEEVHHYFHPQVPNSAAGKQAEHVASGHIAKGGLAVAPKKSSKGTTAALIGGGALGGAIGHHLYTKSFAPKDGTPAVDALPPSEAVGVADAAAPAPDANAEAPAQAGASPGETASEPAPKKRSLMAMNGDDIDLQRREARNTYIHRDVHHYGKPTSGSILGAAEASLPKAKGIGKMKSLLYIVGGAVGGILGHAFYHNTQVARAEREAAALKQDTAVPVAKRSLTLDSDDDGFLQRRDMRSAMAKTIFGAFAGTAVGATIYAHKHNNPGVRKQITVPAGTLKPEGGSLLKRSLDDQAAVAIERRGFGKLLGKFSGAGKGLVNIIKGGGKKSTAIAIATGAGLSTAAALVDPGAPEAKNPAGKRSLVEGVVLRKREPQVSQIMNFIKPVTKAWANLGAKHGKIAQKGVIVAGASFGAGATGLLRKRDLDMGDEGDAEEDADSRKRALTGHGVGQMLDVATIGLVAGTVVKGAIHLLKPKKKVAPPTGPVKVPSLAALGKRDLHHVSHARRFALEKRSLQTHLISNDRLRRSGNDDASEPLIKRSAALPKDTSASMVLEKREPDPLGFGAAKMGLKALSKVGHLLKKRELIDEVDDISGIKRRSPDPLGFGAAKMGLKALSKVGHLLKKRSLRADDFDLARITKRTPDPLGFGAAKMGLKALSKVGHLLKKRSLSELNDEVAVHSLKRRQLGAHAGVGGAFIMPGPSFAVPVTNAAVKGYNAVKRAFGKVKGIFHKRSIDHDETALAREGLDQSLYRRGMLGNVGNVGSLALTAAPLVSPVVKGIGKGFSKIGKLFHKRSLSRDEDSPVAFKRNVNTLSDAEELDKRGNVTKFFSTASIATMAGSLLAGPIRAVFKKKDKNPPAAAGAAPQRRSMPFYRRAEPSYTDYLHALENETQEKLSKISGDGKKTAAALVKRATSSTDAPAPAAEPAAVKADQPAASEVKADIAKPQHPAKVETHVRSNGKGEVTVATKITFNNETSKA